ncbi:MAG: AraC family transcriptional regulator [Eubacteriales bacterium]|nr:AraC family transcriptional regulator [Eubacteriales bacterium]
MPNKPNHQVEANLHETTSLTENLPMPMILHGMARDLSFTIPKKDVSIHDYFELSYLRKGRLEFKFSDHERCLLNAGSTMIIKPHVPHRIRPLASNCETITIYFDFLNQDSPDEEVRRSRRRESFDQFLEFALERSDERAGEEVIGRPFILIEGKYKDRIAAIGNEIINEVNEDLYGSKMMSRALAVQLLIFAGRAIHQEWEETLQVREGQASELVHIARNYMDENFCETITVSDVAQYVFLSVGYFARAFRDEFGESPTSYLMRKRVEHACELLKANTMKISTVAELCGFSTPQRFNSQFKRRMGLTPLNYRKRENQQ